MPYTQPSHLQRGSVPLQHGDITAQRAQLARAEADSKAAVIANTARELTDDPDCAVILVDIPGKSSQYAIAKYAYDAIKRSATDRSGRL